MMKALLKPTKRKIRIKIMTNTKLKFAKITRKRLSVLMETNANSLMVLKNSTSIVKRWKMPTEQKNANHSGNMEPVPMDLVANFCTFRKFHLKKSSFFKEYSKSFCLGFVKERVNSLNLFRDDWSAKKKETHYL